MRKTVVVIPAALLLILCLVLILRYASPDEASGNAVVKPTAENTATTAQMPASPTEGEAATPTDASDTARATPQTPTPDALPAADISQVAASESDSGTCFPYRPNSVYAPETGHHVHRPFLSTWQKLGPAILGLPITEPLTLDSQTVQYFEHGRLEYHPGTIDTGPEILLTSLGSWKAEQLDNPAFTPQPEGQYADDPSASYVEQTGHYVRAPLVAFWEANGGSAIFGNPISDQFDQDGKLVQYFEAMRLEWIKSPSGEGGAVQVGELGSEFAESNGIDLAPVQRKAGVPNYNAQPDAQPVHIPAILYHKIGAPETRYRVSLWSFEQQLVWLRENGYTSITMDQAYAAVYRGAPLPEKPILITFDDGWAGQWEAASLLDAYGMHGVFFIMPNKIELTHDQVRDLLRRGHEIGSHSVTHADLTDIPDEDLRTEIVSSKAMIEEITGEDVDYLAYPYGKFDEHVISIVQSAGYCGAAEALHPNGATWAPETRWNQPRVDIPGEINLDEFANLIESL